MKPNVTRNLVGNPAHTKTFHRRVVSLVSRGEGGWVLNFPPRRGTNIFPTDSMEHFFVINQFELREQLKRQTICRQSATEKPKNQNNPTRKDEGPSEKKIREAFGKAENAVYLGNLLEKQQEVKIHQGAIRSELVIFAKNWDYHCLIRRKIYEYF